MDLEKIFTSTRDFVTHVNHYQIINVGGFPENETIGLVLYSSNPKASVMEILLCCPKPKCERFM